MSAERAELPGEESERNWRDRLADIASAAGTLLATRLEIFRAEASIKAVLIARGLAFIVVAAALTVGALLLGAALLAALFAKLFGSVVLGILAAVVLYGGAAAVAVRFALQSLTRARPLEFPATSAEVARDFDAVAAALWPAPGPSEGSAGPAPQDPTVEDLEERFRAGSE